MYSFKEIVRARKMVVPSEKVKIAVLGNCSTQFLSQAIEGNCRIEGINADVLDLGYNQIDYQLIDVNSETFIFKPNIILLYIASEKLYEDFCDLSFNDKQSFADETANKIINYWDLINAHSNSKILQFNFAEINDRVLGNYSIKNSQTFSYQIKKLNYLLSEAMRSRNNVFPIDLQGIQGSIGYNKIFDWILYYNSKMPLSLDALPVVSNQVVSVIKSFTGKIKKCLVMDLDNTIWGGIIGDDGLDRIELGELGRGHCFVLFQKWIKQLKECGIILAVCSKNDEKIAKEPFEKHPDMVLRLADISLFVANWNDKASNLRLIQETLNIGFDSIVFIDDNPFERELVKKELPEICVPDLPEDPALYLPFMIENNYFEVSTFTGEKSDRTSLYQAEFERKKSESTFNSISDYLSSLEMLCSVKPFEKNQYARIAQLSQRSNQFNLRTIRYTENEIENIANDCRFKTLAFNLHDKFGDYGLVSIVVIRIDETNKAFIETWLMSCRAFKRGLEDFVMNKIVEECSNLKINVLEGEYIQTIKNSIVKDIYKEYGFSEISKDYYSIKVDEYKSKKNFIKEEN